MRDLRGPFRSAVNTYQQNCVSLAPKRRFRNSGNGRNCSLDTKVRIGQNARYSRAKQRTFVDDNRVRKVSHVFTPEHNLELNSRCP